MYRNTLVPALAALTGLALLCAPLAASAQTFPSKPLRLVLPYGSGATPDILARLVADRLSAKYGQPVVVDNKPSAGGVVAGNTVKTAPADGYTLLLADNGMLAISPHLYKNYQLDPPKDFTPVTQLVDQPFQLWVNKALGAKNLKELAALAKLKPGSINYGTVGNGSPHHLCAAMFARIENIELVHIPYRSAMAQLVPAMIANDVSLTCTSPVAAAAMAASGKVEPLATASPRRLKTYPAVPTVAEATGQGDLVVGSTMGILVKAGTPAKIVEQLAGDIEAIMRSPELVARLEGMGMEVVTAGPQAYAKTIRADYQRYGEMVQVSGAKED